MDLLDHFVKRLGGSRAFDPRTCDGARVDPLCPVHGQYLDETFPPVPPHGDPLGVGVCIGRRSWACGRCGGVAAGSRCSNCGRGAPLEIWNRDSTLPVDVLRTLCRQDKAPSRDDRPSSD